MSHHRPRIGITCDMRELKGSRGNLVEHLLVPRAYAAAVTRGGALPVLLPIVSVDDAPALLDTVDGLVVSGGAFDVPPAFYGEEPLPGIGPTHEERSQCERALLQHALARHMPCLGVCGGMQLLDVVCGGTLFQDLSHRPDTAVHEQPTDPATPFHDVVIESDSRLAQLWPSRRLAVNSTHHQLVRDVGAGVQVVARAADGCVEAIEVQTQPFAIGVQWHPEALVAADAQHQRIYDALIEAARAHATRGDQ